MVWASDRKHALTPSLKGQGSDLVACKPWQSFFSSVLSLGEWAESPFGSCYIENPINCPGTGFWYQSNQNSWWSNGDFTSFWFRIWGCPLMPFAQQISCIFGIVWRCVLYRTLDDPMESPDFSLVTKYWRCTRIGYASLYDRLLSQIMLEGDCWFHAFNWRCCIRYVLF